MSHSKRNTSRPVFTAHERALAKSAWSSNKARLTRDSYLSLGSCSLCLETAVDPVSCPFGDVFCRECALSNILAQKQEIKRLARAQELQRQDEGEEKLRDEGEERERAVREFEMVQNGFDIKGRRRGEDDAGEGQGDEQVRVSKTGEKRKFELDEDQIRKNEEQERAKARKAIDEEKDSKSALPSFWVPSVAASISKAATKADKLHEITKAPKTSPICPSSQDNNPHPYALTTLVTVNFTEELDSIGVSQRICPSCKKRLTNSSKAVLAKPCGHVLCKSCITQFVKPSGKVDPHAPEEDVESVRCFVCDADVTERKGGTEKKKKDKIRPGLVELRSDGTGFSASGVSEVRKSSVGFQC